MKKRSAGILMYKRDRNGLRLLLVHPGGPFWKNRDSWSIPKGEYDAGEDPLAVAKREFGEELGGDIIGPVVPLGEIVQAGGKAVMAWAAEGDFDVATLKSNTFEMEWPPRSRRRQSFPEVDRAGWFTPAEARRKLLAAQRPFIDRLLQGMGDPHRTTSG
jgi:predicted NUDIX family NTP pyrophosphohydrolase